MLFIFFGEFLNALDDYTLFEKIQIAFFNQLPCERLALIPSPLPRFIPLRPMA